MTGLVLIVTEAFLEKSHLSTSMVNWAFSKGLGRHIGYVIVMISLILFAFTMILAWSYCAGKAYEFLFGLKMY
jgi:AGCS family alanine or glycine:cation symporter